MFGAKKLGEKLASAIESRAVVLEQGKLQLSTDERDNRLMVKVVAMTLKMVADAIRQVAVEE